MAAVASSRRDELLVMIAGATGLRNADWSPFTQDKSDPYCICHLSDKPEVTIRTAVIQNTLNPVWNHMDRIVGFKPGDTLNLTVWDQDVGKKDDKLGFVKLPSSMFLPYGFTGKLQLTQAGNQTAAIYLVVQPMPICSGTLDVMRMRSLEPRFFSLHEDMLLYFTDSEDYAIGTPERGSIMLADVEQFEVDKNRTLMFYIYRLPQPIQIHCRSWEEASKWGAGIDRALMLRGVGNVQELDNFIKVPFCEGFLRLEAVGGSTISKEEPLYVALFPDVIIGYKEYLTFRNNQGDSLWAEALSQITCVEAESCEAIGIQMAGKAYTLHTSGWDETMRWGSGFMQALEHTELDETGSDKVDWPSFLMLILCQGSLDIVRGSGALSRFFVMYGDHMAYFNTKEDFDKKGKKHGAVEFQHVTKVILGNDITLTIKLFNGSVFQLRELEPGACLAWAGSWDSVLRLRGMPGVLRFDWGSPQFEWDFLMGAESNM